MQIIIIIKLLLFALKHLLFVININRQMKHLILFYLFLLSILVVNGNVQTEQELNTLLLNRDGVKAIQLIENNRIYTNKNLLQLKTAYCYYLLIKNDDCQKNLQSIQVEELKSNETLFIYYFLKGFYDYLNQIENYNSSIENFLKVLHLSKIKDQPEYIQQRDSKIHEFLSTIYYYLGQQVLSLKHLELGYQRALIYGMELEISSFSNNLGIIYKNDQKYSKALQL